MARNGLTQKQRFWIFHIESCASSGIPMRVYADRHGLGVKDFYRWKSKLKTLGALFGDSKEFKQSTPSSISTASKHIESSAARVETRPEDQCSAAFVRAAIMASEAPQSSEPQERFCGARIALSNGITIDVPEGIAPEALGALIRAAHQAAPHKGPSSS